jgi:hypothetical protein
MATSKSVLESRKFGGGISPDKFFHQGLNGNGSSINSIEQGPHNLPEVNFN